MTISLSRADFERVTDEMDGKFVTDHIPSYHGELTHPAIITPYTYAGQAFLSLALARIFTERYGIAEGFAKAEAFVLDMEYEEVDASRIAIYFPSLTLTDNAEAEEA